MRMRKKKNIVARLEDCGDLLLRFQPSERSYSAQPDGNSRLDLAKWFGNDRPVEMELGCGKGAFICEKARLNPHINFLAVERSENVLVLAAERAKAMGLSNVRFLATYVEYLPHLLSEHFTERLYLNFSCPFPKKRYATHRLTHPRFLTWYRRWLTPDGRLYQKTDDGDFFAFSLESLSKNGFVLERVRLDLHDSDATDNIPTEYETKFVEMGKPIHYLEASVRMPAETKTDSPNFGFALEEHNTL